MYDRHMMCNTTVVSRDATARTQAACAQQRAENVRFVLDVLGHHDCARLIELCVGPSYEVLRAAYENVRIECWGNDIDPLWERRETSRWITADALHIVRSLDDMKHRFDVVVFAPPLTVGCTGLRHDLLMIDDVTPRFDAFIEQLDVWFKTVKFAILVIPGRARSTKEDRCQLHKLTSRIIRQFDVIDFELKVGCTKYIDMFVFPRAVHV